MFDSFSSRVVGIFEKLRKSGILKESDIDEALREIRIALLEADVSLEVAKKFIAEVKEKAIGQNIIKSISPSQTVTKIVHDHLVETLGKSSPIEANNRPYKIMLVGLQGAGKTTTTGKLAKFFSAKGKTVAAASADIYRPAAIRQLEILLKKIDGVIFAQSANLACDEICDFALKATQDKEADVLIMDTAGRLHIDEIKMDELQKIQKIINPDEIILVVNIMTGQDAFNVANKFSEMLKITGVILTQVDGDARGGVALSMRAVTGCEIKFLCTGEQLDDIEFFDAENVANRLLGMGDIVSLVKKVQDNFSEEADENTKQNLIKGNFTFEDFATHMSKMSKLGGLKTIIKLLPHNDKITNLMNTYGISDKTIVQNHAIITSMTKEERKNYKLLNGSRRKRIALGSGTDVQKVNQLVKQYENALRLYKQMEKNGMSKMMSMIGKMK